MSELHGILRHADGKLPAGFKAVHLDRSGSPVAGSGGFRSLLAGALGGTAWFVQPDVPCALDRRTIDLAERDFDDKATVDVDLEVVIPERTHREAVAALVRDGDPVLKITDVVRRVVQREFRAHAARERGLHALERYARIRTTLEDAARDEALRELSIDLHVRFKLDPQLYDPSPLQGNYYVKDLLLVVPDFNVALSDRLAHSAPLALDLTLKRSGPVSVVPPGSEQAWRDCLRQAMVQEAPREITAADYYGDRDELGKRIAQVLAKTLAPFGRSVGRIDVRARRELPVPPSQTVDVDLLWIGKPSGFPVHFKVSATLRVDPERRQIYLAHGSPAYLDWLQKHARQAIDEKLVAADYVHLTTEYVAKLQDQLKDMLTDQAKKDGLQIDPFVAKPDVPEIVRTRRTAFSTGKEQYQTRDGSFQVSLEISVSGWFDTLEHVTPLLQAESRSDSGVSKLTVRMKQVTIDAAAQVLRDADARRYVLRFDAGIDLEGLRKSPPDPKPDKVRYLADTLRAKIRSELERYFGFLCNEADIQLIQKDDQTAELIKWIYELGTFSIKVQVEPRDAPGAANQHDIEVTYQVHAVDPESILAVIRHNPAREELHANIKQQLKNWTKDVLSAMPASILRDTDTKERWALRDKIDDYVQKEFKLFFGAEVKALSITIGRSGAELVKIEQTEELLQLDVADMSYRYQRIDDPEYRAERRRQLAADSARNRGSGPQAPEEGGGGEVRRIGSRRQDGNNL